MIVFGPNGKVAYSNGCRVVCASVAKAKFGKKVPLFFGLEFAF